MGRQLPRSTVTKPSKFDVDARILWLTLLAAFIFVWHYLSDHNGVSQNVETTRSINTPIGDARPLLTTKEYMNKSEQIWSRTVRKRREIITSKNLTKMNPWDGREPKIWWDYFYATYNCPHHLERIGGIGDGGKWICGFSLFQNNSLPCVVYSFGLAGETSFEEEIVNRTNCVIWAYDNSIPFIKGPLRNESRVHFELAGLSAKTNGMLRTLGDFMKENNHSWIDILKIDIEGAEYSVLDQIMDEFSAVPFGQLQIELHLGVLGDDLTFESFYRWWERMEEKGLRPVLSEQNNYNYAAQSKPSLYEYAFINVKAQHRLTM